MRKLIVALIVAPYILVAQTVELRVQTGHTGFPKSITLSQDGKWIASAGSDKLIKIWDVPTGREVKSFFHETLIGPSVVSIGVGRKYMASASVYEVRLWDLEKNIEVENFNCPLFVNQTLYTFKGVAVHPTLPILAVANYENSGLIALVEIPSAKVIKKLSGHSDYVLSLDFSADGKKLVSGGMDKVVRLWDVEKGKELYQLRKHQDPVFSVDFGGNNLAASSSMYNNITVWDMSTGEEKMSLKGSDKDLTATHVQLSSDDSHLLSCDDNFVRLWNLSTGQEQLKIAGSMKEFPGLTQHNYAMFSNDSKYFYSSFPYITTYNLKGKKIRDFKGLEVYNDELGFDETSSYPIEAKLAKDYALIRYWNINQIITKKINAVAGEKIIFSPGVKFIAVPSASSGAAGKGDVMSARSTRVQIFNGITGEKITDVRGHSNTVSSVAFSSDNSWMATVSHDNTIRIWNTQDFKQRLRIDGLPVTYASGLTKVIISPDNTKLYVLGYNGPVQVYEVGSGKLLLQIPVGPANSPSTASLLAISDNSKYLAVAHSVTDLSRGNVKGQKIGNVKGRSIGMYQAVTVFDATTGKELKLVNVGSAFLQAIKFKPSSTRLVSSDMNGGLKEFEIPSGNLAKEYIGHDSFIKSIAFNMQGTQLISGSMDGTTKLWNTDTGEQLASLITTDSSNFAVVTKDNYYYCSKDAIQKIHFVNKDRVFLFEQYDTKYNRPDLVLSTLHGSKELVAAYERAYRKRLTKLGLTETMLIAEQSVPAITLTQLPDEVATRNATIDYSISASDPQKTLAAIHVLINDVPVFGADGLSVKDQNKMAIEKNISIELTEGSNLVTTYVTNSVNAESDRQTFEIFYEGESNKPNLYLISIGASEFNDAKWNLRYASKDAADVQATFKTKTDLYEKIFEISLTNQNVSLEKINQLGAKLSQAKPNDVVLIFFAGHGLLDKDLNYYLSTYNVNFGNPVEGGLPYEALSSLLDLTPSRKKIVLIDACHSGEVDKESATQATTTTASSGKIVFRAVGDKVVQGKTGLENSFELMKLLFTDLRKNSGATIISASGGFEFALESEEWKNGAFTMCLLDGLKNAKADMDHDGKIMLSELKNYMYKAVPALTQGKQQPTFRTENLRGDFRVW